MRLKNKKTGAIVDTLCDKYNIGIAFVIDHHDGEPTMLYYNSLAELNEEWEDYDEPSKTIWQIKDSGELQYYEEDVFSDGYIESSKSIGNYFYTREEAEKAVEKLKAWKRLKDMGFRFRGRCIKDLTIGYTLDRYDKNEIKQMNEDLDLLFGGNN